MMTEVRLFEIVIKGARLDEINAEERSVLEGHVTTQAQARVLRTFIQHISGRFVI